MHNTSVTALAAASAAGPATAAAATEQAAWGPADRARQGGAVHLAQALQASRADTLATFAAFAQALPGLQVPQRAELNLPLWELGHIGWFQAWWLARFPAWRQGHRANPDGPRHAARLAHGRADADVLYNSSLVPHTSRWQLPLPSADDTRADLQAQLLATLALLAEVDDGMPAHAPAGPTSPTRTNGPTATGHAPTRDDALYFFRLALLHEDMHHEAALYMAQNLGVAITDPRWQARRLPEPPPALAFDPGTWQLGSEPHHGFAFDNELGAHPVALGATHIDAQAVRWAEYLPFVEATGAAAPRYLRRSGTRSQDWQHWRHGQWQALDLAEAACHLTHLEAQAWCRWAGRRLPTEAEWERAAITRPDAFRWGDVWEWTASPFAPYPGFAPHPYRDYSAPWFDGRPVLRGASFMTQPRLRHARYRNYFPAQRNDVPAGFRSCAL